MNAVACSSCPCSRASNGQRVRCPFVEQPQRAGSVAYVEGDRAERVWFVKIGTIVLTRWASDHTETPVAVRGPGTFLGLEAMITPTYRETARVTTAARLCVAERPAMSAWLGPASAPARVALEQTLRVRCADPVRAAAADGTALRRVARWILATEAACEVPRQFAAGFLGIAPETLSRALAQLARAGAIEVTRTTITPCDRGALQRAAGD
jgi:CRP-like cAMP-binding protein